MMGFAATCETVGGFSPGSFGCWLSLCFLSPSLHFRRKDSFGCLPFLRLSAVPAVKGTSDLRITVIFVDFQVSCGVTGEISWQRRRRRRRLTVVIGAARFKARLRANWSSVLSVRTTRGGNLGSNKQKRQHLKKLRRIHNWFCQAVSAVPEALNSDEARSLFRSWISF